MELKTVMIDGLEYKVVLKGAKKFAYFKPVNDWLGSTMPVWKIEQAIKDAKNAKPKHRKTDVVERKGSAKEEVLKCLAESTEPLSYAEIAEETEITESTIVSAIRVMRKTGQIIGGEDKRTKHTNWPSKSWLINGDFVEGMEQKPEPAKKAGRKPSTPNILKALTDGPQTMRDLRKKTGHGPTAIRSAMERLGDRVRSKKVARLNAWETRSTVTVWELVA